MSSEPYKELLRIANDNCDSLAMSRAQAMAYVRALCVAAEREGSRAGRHGPLASTKELLLDAKSWLADPLGIERPQLPDGYEVSPGPNGMAKWATPCGFSATASTEAVAAIKCWDHWALKDRTEGQTRP